MGLFDIIKFVRTNIFEDEVSCRKLRSLWTSYCVLNKIDVGTTTYNRDLKILWGVVKQEEEDTAYWSDLDSFDRWISEDLI